MKPPGARPQSVLFACGQNVIRSPMAMALAKHLFGKSIYIGSAGVKHTRAPRSCTNR